MQGEEESQKTSISKESEGAPCKRITLICMVILGLGFIVIGISTLYVSLDQKTQALSQIERIASEANSDIPLQVNDLQPTNTDSAESKIEKANSWIQLSVWGFIFCGWIISGLGFCLLCLEKTEESLTRNSTLSVINSQGGIRIEQDQE